MDPFQRAQLKDQELLGQLQAGEISREAFEAAVAQLRVQDAQGTWWLISPTTGNWCYWDGAAWVEATQPPAVQTQSVAPVFAPQPPDPDAFDQTAEQYRALLDRRNRGELDAATFEQAVAALRVTDGGGAVWQIVSQTGIWVRWDGQQWVEAEPPIQTPDGRPATEPSIYADFDQHYQQVLGVFQQGGMSEQQFQDKVARLRVKDEQGVWWQILPDTGQWARWSGQQWVSAEPPRELVGAIGPVRKFTSTIIDSTKAQVKETVRSIPRMIMWWLISRGVMMAISYFGALYLHAYLCGYKNDGFRDDGGAWAPWLYLTGTKQGALSAPMIWGVAGMLLTTLVMTIVRRGPIGAVKSIVQMPFSFFSMVRSGGKAGAGAIAMGAGAAIAMKHFAGINSQASYSLSLGMFVMGMGTAGRLVSGFFLGIVRRVFAPQRQQLTQAVERRLPVDVRTIQLVLVGIAPGFLLAARLGANVQLLAAGVLLVLGFVLVFKIRKPQPSAGVAAMLLFYGFVMSVICLLLDFLSSRNAYADDGGKQEFGGPPEKYWPTEGGKLLDHSKTAADSSALGAAVGGDTGGDEPPPPPPPYSFFLVIDETHMNLTRSLREDVHARVQVTGPDPAECAALAAQLTSAINFGMSGNCTEWFTCGQEEGGGSMRGYFDLLIPDDANKIPGPHLAAFTASVNTPKGLLSRTCRISVTVVEGYELRMSNSMSLKANAESTSLFCGIACNDDTIPDSKEVIEAAIPNIQFKVEGTQTHWVREADGAPGVVTGQIVPNGKEACLFAEVPLADLSTAPPYGVSVTASVEIPKVGSLSQVCSVDITAPEWFIEAKIIKNELVLDFKDSAEICARLIPMEESKLALYGSAESNPLNNILKVQGTGSNGPYAVFTEKTGEPGFRTWSVTFSQDLPQGMGEVAPTIDVEIVADITGQILTQPITINLIGKPSLEVTEKMVGIRAGGDPVAVHVILKDGGDLDWSLRIEILNLDEVEPTGPPESEEKGKWTLNLRGAEVDAGDLRVRSGTLKLTAHATNAKGEETETDPVEVELKLAQTGLSVSPSPVKLPLDPAKEQPTPFKVRVLKYNDETKTFEASEAAMQALEMEEWEDGDFTGGANTFKGAGVELLFVRFEGSGADLEAIWHAKQKIQIPASQLIDAVRVLRAPGNYGDQQDLFEVRHTFVAPVDPSALQAEKIRIEQENCRKTLKYVPEGPAKIKFAETIEKDAKTLGAEGLYHLRHEIWEVARKALTNEAESYLRSAEVLQVAEDVCNWVNYVCKMLVSGMSSVLVPFPGDMVVNVLMDAIPDLVNAVWAGRSPVDWAKEFVTNFVAGIPGMGVDIALGQVANLEDLVLRAAKESKDFKKGCLVGCLIYWQVHFIRYQVSSKPDGEPYSLKECMLKALSDLAEEIVSTGIGKGTKAAKDGHDAAFGHGYDAADGSVYTDSGKPPDTSGMPDANIAAAKKIALENGVEIYVRPTNPASKALLEAGAHPKPETIKSKTINELDLQLGGKRRPEDLGKVGYFDPGPNPPPKGNMSDGDYANLMDRYKQRRQEFVDNAGDFAKLKKKGTTVDENGVVTAKDGKCYTGDHDIYDIRGKNGEPVDPATYKKVVGALQDSTFQAQHPGNRQWDYSMLDKKKPPPSTDVDGKPVTPQSKYDKAKGIDGKIIDSHQATTSSGKEGEALIKFGADGQVSGQHLKPPPSTFTKTGRATQSVAKTMQRDREEKEKQ